MFLLTLTPDTPDIFSEKIYKKNRKIYPGYPPDNPGYIFEGTHVKPQDLINKAKKAQSSKSRNITIVMSIFYFIFMIVYGITVNVQADFEQKSLGWMNILLVFVTDALILCK